MLTLEGLFMKEIWKDIVGYEGIYQVNDNGYVKNLKTGRKTLGSISSKYAKVALTKDKKVKYYFVHRLVAEAFIPNINSKQQVNHKDSNKRNNNANNLEWATNKENYEHSIECGSRRKNNWEKGQERRKTKVVKIDLMTGDCIQSYESIAEAAYNNNIDSANIIRVCKGERKTTGGYGWEYV